MFSIFQFSCFMAIQLIVTTIKGVSILNKWTNEHDLNVNITGIVSISVIPVLKNDTTSQDRVFKKVSKKDFKNDFNNIFLNNFDTDFKNDFKNVFTKRQTPVAADCGTQLTSLKIGDTGNITSPNYPNLYPPSVKCAWWIQVWKLFRFFVGICICPLTNSHFILNHGSGFYKPFVP